MQLILNTLIPQNKVKDRIAWAFSSDGKYSVKSGYKYWQEQFAENIDIISSDGWSRIWRVDVPHKIRIFLWRFCRNNVPVRNRLHHKGVNVPILCLLCNDVEHLIHVFLL